MNKLYLSITFKIYPMVMLSLISLKMTREKNSLL